MIAYGICWCTCSILKAYQFLFIKDIIKWKDILQRMEIHMEVSCSKTYLGRIPVQYHKSRYPLDIKPTITEVAGHFDVSRLIISGDYSLHTEYSFTEREFNSETIKKYRSICEANKRGIPMLWYSKEWALEFADFIREIAQDTKGPNVIEIHPPFSDYSDIRSFLDSYIVFERKIRTSFPDVIILIENRSGTRYSGGDFILSSIDQLKEFSILIEQYQVDLRITLDLPQLFTTHQISKSKVETMGHLFEGIKSIRHNILGIHLWGKRESENGRRVAHVGDLTATLWETLVLRNSFLGRCSMCLTTSFIVISYRR